MKRTFLFLIALVVLVAFSSPSFAYPKPVEKLKDGVTAVVTSPLEIRDHAIAEAKPGSFLPFSLVGGMLKGGFYMAKKMVGGALDIATFPINR